MSPDSSPRPWQKFLSGLLATSLGLLLPVQLCFLWLAASNRPVALPEFASEFLTREFAKQNIRLQARHFWILPDRSLAADDLRVEITGLSGEIFSAEYAEVGLSFTSLLSGTLRPNRLLIRDGKLWCPAAVAQKGVRQELISEIRVDLRREGQWLMAPVIRAHSSKLNIIVTGELPLGLLSPDEAKASVSSAAPTETTLAPQISSLLRNLETFIITADRSGGASVNITAEGTSSGGAKLRTQILFGDDWMEADGAIIRMQHLQAKGFVELTPQATLKSWNFQINGRHLAYQNYQAERFQLSLAGTTLRSSLHGQLAIAHAHTESIPDCNLQATLRESKTANGLLPIEITACTPQSYARGQLNFTSLNQIPSIDLAEAQIATDELLNWASYRDAMRQAKIHLDGQILLQEFHGELRADGTPALQGEIGFSGLDALGLSSATIAPGADLPLSAKFAYQTNPAATRPLQLSELHLGTVTGEANCFLQKGGDYTLHLRGPIAPPSLNTILGEWWVSLWKMFNLKSYPLAVIDVEGQWGTPQSTTTGFVQLEQFNFLEAPFRHVGVVVQANPQGTYIGLQRLAGGTESQDGSLDGSAVWDWSKPPTEAGPVVKLKGNLQPWIAARCAGAELSEALRGLALPLSQTFELEVLPDVHVPRIKAQVTCPKAFQAWGIPSENLNLEIRSDEHSMLVNATANLAGGHSSFNLQGDPLKTPDLNLKLQGCDPKKIQLVLEQIEGGKATTAEPNSSAPAATLDLNFKGRIDLKKPRYLRGLGDFVLVDPDLKKVRTLGSVSKMLEGLGMNITTYDLQTATGHFGCIEGKTYFPDLTISGKQAKIALQGEVDLLKSTLHFEGDCSLPRDGSLSLLEIFNLNRTLFNLTRIKVDGPISKPETSVNTKLPEIINSKKDNTLGKIPATLLE